MTSCSSTKSTVCHRWWKVLYPAMEDYQLDIMIGEGPAARSIKLDLPPFTLVGATTRAGSLTSPLRDRFGIVQRLEFYQVADLQHIVSRSAGCPGLELSDEGPMKWRAGRGDATYCQPSVAPGARLRRSARQRGDQRFGGGAGARYAQRRCRRLRLYGSQTAAGDYRQVYRRPGRAGQLAAAIGEERETIEDVIEPFLIQQGFIQRTPRGRLATQHAYRHFGLEREA